MSGYQTRSSRARHGGPVGELLTQRGGRSSHPEPELASMIPRQNTCLSPRCSIDITTIEIRPPKFLHGKQPNGTNCQGCPNSGTVASWDRCQRFTRPASHLSGGHPGIYTPDLCPALRKCPYGANNINLLSSTSPAETGRGKHSGTPVL